MSDYLPSLMERKQRFLEYCCGGGDDMGGGPMDSGEPPTADSEENSLINRTLDKLRSKKKTRKQRNGT